MSFLNFANPNRFTRFSRYAMPITAVIGLLCIVWAMYQVWFIIPDDYQQGSTIKIMFIHVPAAWLSLWVYMLIAVSAFGTLVWKHPLADVSAKAAVLFGAAFSAITLITGSLWGKPMWGAWWDWDARLTSMLILFLLYLGFMAVWHAVDDPILAGKINAILALVGIALIPFIILSVEYFNTIHQGKSVNPFGETKLSDQFLYPLLWMTAGVTSLFLSLHMLEMRNELMLRRIRRIQILRTNKR